MNYYKNFQNHFSSAAVADFLKSKPDDKLDTIKNLFVEYQLILGEYKYFRFLPNTSSKTLIRFEKDDDNGWKKHYIIDEIDYDWRYVINENGTIELTAYKYRKFRKNLEKDDVKEEGIKKDDQTILTSLEDYIKTASYLGTKVKTPTMRRYIYRRRLDGLSILNTLLVDKKLSIIGRMKSKKISLSLGISMWTAQHLPPLFIGF